MHRKGFALTLLGGSTHFTCIDFFLPLIIRYAVAPRCSSGCAVFKVCKPQCVDLKSVCGDVLKVFIYDDFYSAVTGRVVASPGLHNLQVDLEARGITSATGVGTIMRLMAQVFKYKCDGEDFAQKSSNAADACSSSSSIAAPSAGITGGSCTFEALYEFSQQTTQFRADKYRYEEEVKVRRHFP